MLTNYLKLAFRHLVKKKFTSFINIIGLSAGMAVCILISLWMWDELSFDKYHSNYDKIAKVRMNVTANGEITTGKTVPVPLINEIKTYFRDDFKYIVPSSHRARHILASGEKKLFKKGVYLGSDAPAMLGLVMTRGDVSALTDKHSIILSASSSRSFFGSDDPINKVLTIDNAADVKVTGVFEDLPGNTTLADVEFIAPFDLYAANETWMSQISDPWGHSPIQLYVQLSPAANVEQVSSRIKNVVQQKIGNSNIIRKTEVILEPMSRWHLYAYRNGLSNPGSIRYVRMFGLVGFFVLLLACFNFMNLSTARSEKRAREVGVRKAMGSSRSQLIGQFFSESVLLSLLAFGCAVLLVQLTMPFFNDVAGKTMAIPWDNGYFWMWGLLFTIITGLLAGSYPALYLSSFQAIKVLKGSFRVGSSAAVFRKSLVVVQFSVSVMLVVCTIVVFRQIEHARQRPSGYNPDGLILVPMTATDMPLHMEAVKTTLMQSGTITNLATSESTTTDIWGTDNDISWTGKDPNMSVDFPNTGVSADYGKTIGWKFVDGRDFSNEFASDSAAFILNEAAVKLMGLQHPVGEVIRWQGNPFTVIGVIRDMIVESPYEPVKPSIYCLARNHNNFAVLKLHPSLKTAKAMSTVEAVFKNFFGSVPFEYEFINDKYADKFAAEERVGKLSGYFTFLAIFISCLGIFAMASFMAEQRAKEIGVRKVFGASVMNVWKLLSVEFVKLVVLSLLIAIPVSYYFMHGWLQNYYYRTTITWWILLVIGIGALALTLMTVSFQTIKAALANPVKSLRDE